MSFSGCKHSEKAKEKMRKKREGRKPALGMKHTEKTKEKIRKKREGKKPGLGKTHSEVWNRKIGEAAKRVHNDPSFKEKFKTKMKESAVKSGLKKRMLNGQAVYMNSFIKNPSTPQIKTYDNTKELYPETELNYSLHLENEKWYSLDVAILRLKIDIEYDEPYWHQNLEKDKIRDENLKKFDWKILRYRGYVPSIDRLKEDIKRLL